MQYLSTAYKSQAKKTRKMADPALFVDCQPKRPIFLVNSNAMPYGKTSVPEAA
jgi:hypothetical protein